jgi:hypothetical protein
VILFISVDLISGSETLAPAIEERALTEDSTFTPLEVNI